MEGQGPGLVVEKGSIRVGRGDVGNKPGGNSLNLLLVNYVMVEFELGHVYSVRSLCPFTVKKHTVVGISSSSLGLPEMRRVSVQ